MVSLELFGVESLHLVDDGQFDEGAAAALDGDVLQPLHNHWQAVLVLPRVEHTAADIADLSDTHPHGLSGCTSTRSCVDLVLNRFASGGLAVMKTLKSIPCSNHHASPAS